VVPLKCCQLQIVRARKMCGYHAIECSCPLVTQRGRPFLRKVF
jgi:hypothetical protein